jgi:hypothetical protein
LDRAVFGNILLEELKGKYRLVATDQSDCFLGAGSLADGSFAERSRRTGAVAYPQETFTPRALAEPGGLSRLESAIVAVENCPTFVNNVLGRVPSDWWQRSGIRPDEIGTLLTERAGRIREIVNYEQWRNLGNFISGGQLLGG